jgi:hypothetical protein
VAFIAGGPTAAHCIIGDVAGALYTWGRNEVGWLGRRQFERSVPGSLGGPGEGRSSHSATIALSACRVTARAAATGALQRGGPRTLTRQ